MRFECWITKATNTHSVYATHIAFPLKQRSRERASTLHLYVHCLSYCNLNNSTPIARNEFQDPQIKFLSLALNSISPSPALGVI
jgi:hypothetical protein